MANAKHLEILKSGVEKWNEWFKQNTMCENYVFGPQHFKAGAINMLDGSPIPYEYLGVVEGVTTEIVHVNALTEEILKGYLCSSGLYAFLPKIDLAKANLSNIKLSGAFLTGANLSLANLQDAKLYGAFLATAFLEKANLRNARMNNADLSRANINSADLGWAELKGANLKGASLINTKLHHADLTGADLTGADLTGADLTGAKLNYADLTKVNLTNAVLCKSKLIKTDLSEAILENTNLSGADLTKAILISCKFTNTIISNCQLKSTVFGATDLSSCKGMETIQANGPCIIDLQTIISSVKLPREFLIKLGIQNSILKYLPDIYKESLSYFSAFISYSSQNKAFARKLYEALITMGVSTYFDEKELKPGDDIHDSISEGIKYYDKLILVCSENSLKSWWVEKELEKVYEKEREMQKTRGKKFRLVIPIRIDDHVLHWKEGIITTVRNSMIGDFTQWQDDVAFEKAVKELVDALNANRLDIKPTPLL